MKFQVQSIQLKETFTSIDELMYAVAVATFCKNRDRKNLIISPVTEVSVGKKGRYYNNYFLLLDAGMRKQAKLLKRKLKTQFEIDIEKEPKHSDIK